MSRVAQREGEPNTEEGVNPLKVTGDNASTRILAESTFLVQEKDMQTGLRTETVGPQTTAEPSPNNFSSHLCGATFPIPSF